MQSHTIHPPYDLWADDNTLQGSKKQGSPRTHLHSVVGHCLGLPLSRQAIDDKTNEIKSEVSMGFWREQPSFTCSGILEIRGSSLNTVHRMIGMADEVLELE